MIFKDLFAGILELVRNNFEYLKLMNVLRSVKLLKLHRGYYIQAKKKFSVKENVESNFNKEQLINDGCFIRKSILNMDLVSSLLSNLESSNARYEYSGQQTVELINDNANPVLPDYKLINISSEAPGAHELLKNIYLPLVAPIELANGCFMRPVSIAIYRTYGRSLNDLESQGDYGSFKLHFDNSGILNTCKVMCYLSDVTEYENGPLEIIKGSHKLTKIFLPALGGSRIPETLVRNFEHFNWYGKKGDALSFNVKTVHRGGKTTIGTREVVVVELIPSFLEYGVYIEKFNLIGGEHIRGQSYTSLRENPYQNSN
jgi:hypothetical protein